MANSKYDDPNRRHRDANGNWIKTAQSTVDEIQQQGQHAPLDSSQPPPPGPLTPPHTAPPELPTDPHGRPNLKAQSEPVPADLRPHASQDPTREAPEVTPTKR